MFALRREYVSLKNSEKSIRTCLCNTGLGNIIQRRSFLCVHYTKYFTAIKSRRLRWPKYVIFMGNEKCIQNANKKYKREDLEDLGMDGELILRWIVVKYGMTWVGLNRLNLGRVL